MHFRRTAAVDTELGGVKIRAGDKVVVWFPSANRDPAVFPDPDTFDPTRSPNEHLSFGHGLHFCLGAYLAGVQMRAMFSAVLGLLGEVEPAGEPVRLRSNFQNGIKSLPVRWSLVSPRDISSVAGVSFLRKGPEQDCGRETDLVRYRRCRRRPGRSGLQRWSPPGGVGGRQQQPGVGGQDRVHRPAVGPVRQRRRGHAAGLPLLPRPPRRSPGRAEGHRRRGRRGCGPGDRGAGGPAAPHRGTGWWRRPGS